MVSHDRIGMAQARDDVSHRLVETIQDELKAFCAVTHVDCLLMLSYKMLLCALPYRLMPDA
ncbi:hypothetical protein MTYM_00737 [Methylococcales bacterium]|nr:hypothetical protein MTYM_00737 [Methylococcales bacterium]